MRLREAVDEFVAQRYAPGSLPTPGHVALAKVHALIDLLENPVASLAPTVVFQDLDQNENPVPFEATCEPVGKNQRLGEALAALATAEESPLKIAILGVKRQPGEPEPIHITTREEYLAAFPGSSPPRSLFETETVTVIEVQDVETAAAAPWPVPYPLEKPGPETVLLEDAIDRSTWGTPGIDHLPSPHPIARIDIAPPISPLYFGDDYPRLARRKA